MKKLNSILLLGLFCMMSIGASAEVYSGSCGDNAKWSLDTTTGLLSITGSGSMTDYSSYRSVPWFRYRSNTKSLLIGDQITSVGSSAFSNCYYLTSVTIGNSVTSIGSSAFDGCSGLTSVTIPNSVTTIGSSAFSGCSSMTSMSVESGNMVYDSRDNCNAIIETASNTLIRGCQSTTIPNSVTSIGNFAFAWCSGLTNVTIPNSVTKIDGSAFFQCSGLTSIVVESGNTVYDSRDNCNAIIKTASNTLIRGCQSTTIPNSVTSIGSSAFHGCSGLTSVKIPNSVTSISSSAFAYCSGLISMVVESGNMVYDSRDNCNAVIETASNTLISGCKNAIIPNSVTSIGSSAFAYCLGLTSVTIPNSVKSIGVWAYRDCSGLTSVTIGNSVTKIGMNAFYGCSSLTSVTIPNSVTSIGTSAFGGCYGLTSVYVKWDESSKIPSLGGSTFSYYRNLYVPYGTKSIYEVKSYWKSFSIIEPSEQTVKISEAKYGTFASRYAAKIPEGVSAYKATVEGSTVTMTKIQDGVIPGDCGVILYAAQGSYTFAPNAEVDQIEGNQLVAVTDRTYTCTGDDVGKVYYLGLDNGGKATFVCLNENGTIPVGKAYLKLDAALDAGAKLDVVFGDEPTGIQTIDNGQLTIDNSKAYNLNGVRVNANYKGIIIMNGKKYMNR